jgi:hypothetical protein
VAVTVLLSPQPARDRLGQKKNVWRVFRDMSYLSEDYTVLVMRLHDTNNDVTRGMYLFILTLSLSPPNID